MRLACIFCTPGGAKLLRQTHVKRIGPNCTRNQLPAVISSPAGAACSSRPAAREYRRRRNAPDISGALRFNGREPPAGYTVVPALIYCLAFVGGFVIMSLELLGGRLLAPWFGSSIYVWGSIITVFMASLSVGYLLGGRWSLTNPSLVRFGAIFLGGAVLLYPLVYFSEPAMLWIFEYIEDPRYGSLAASCVLFVLPTVMLGMISPYSVRLLVKTTEESGSVAGRLYFVSTLGSTLGTLGTSFYFVLWFEIDTILTLLTGSLVPMGVLAIAAGTMRR